jgi:DtxR family Mn-dependent transcriptional regulator
MRPKIPMTDLIDTTEMYLKAIFELEEEGVTPLRARIAERLNHSGPTVSETISRMERDGLLQIEHNRALRLTELGSLRATEVMRKHRLAERLLVDVIGLDWELVHDEACRWEHVISETVERRILGLLEGSRVSPYGLPIPGLELLGEPTNDIVNKFALSTLADLQEGRELTLAAIGEPIQIDSQFLAQLRELGLLPGARITVTREGAEWLVTALGNSDGLLFAEEFAAHLFVDAEIARPN